MVITQITIDEVIRDQITDKTPNGLSETEVRVEIGNENYDNDHNRGISRDRNPRRREESRSHSNSRVSTNHDCVRCYQCQEYDHFLSECPNTPTDKETDYEDADPTSLQMMSQNYSPIDSEREADYLNL